MKFIDKLERKFGNRGIENLTIYIIVSYVLGYALMYINPGALSMLSLNVSEILHGQIWRLVTPGNIEGGELTHITGNLYLLRAKEKSVKIEIR